LTGEQRSQLLDTLIRAEVVAQQAEKDGLDKQGDAPQSLAMMRLQVLERASMANYLKDRKPTDAELKTEYDSQVAAMPKTQYKARHILVKTREEAEAIIADLKKGAKFEKLAADKSLDNSRTNGARFAFLGGIRGLFIGGRAGLIRPRGGGARPPLPSRRRGWR